MILRHLHHPIFFQIETFDIFPHVGSLEETSADVLDLRPSTMTSRIFRMTSNCRPRVSRVSFPQRSRMRVPGSFTETFFIFFFVFLFLLRTTDAQTTYATPGGALPPASAYIMCNSNGLYWTRNSGAHIICNATSTSTADVFYLSSFAYGTSIEDAEVTEYVSCDNGNGANAIIANRGSPSTWEVRRVPCACLK